MLSRAGGGTSTPNRPLLPFYHSNMFKSTFFFLIALAWVIYDMFFKPEGFRIDSPSWIGGFVTGLLIYNLVFEFKNTQIFKIFKEMKHNVFGK